MLLELAIEDCESNYISRLPAVIRGNTKTIPAVGAP
jgi:hypothetical protein